MNEPIITPAECRDLAERLGLIEPAHKPTEQEVQDILDGKRIYTTEILPNGEIRSKQVLPNFRDPVVVLREAVKMEDWFHFLSCISRDWHGPTELILDTFYRIFLSDTTGKLARALLEFLRKEQGK